MKILTKLAHSYIIVSTAICFLVFLMVIGLRSRGNLQFLEFAAYDYYTQFHSGSFPQDSRIVLITITEEDIQRQKRWPLTDSILANMIKTLITYNPRVIGLDIYRDIPVPPGRKELTDVLSQCHTIVTIRKISTGVAPGVREPYIKNEHVGFSDVIIDSDGIVRRGLLFLDDGEHAYSSFPLLLALLYLKEDGVFAQPGVPNPEHLRLGETTFIPLEANDGCYINTDARGYQFLIDYHGPHKPDLSFTLTDVLTRKIRPDAIKDKVVIIGVTAESVKDAFTSPISRFLGFGKLSYGLEIHARVVKQLLRSASGDSKPLRFIREFYEWSWIFFWSLFGCLAGLWVRSFYRFFLVVAGGVSLLVLTTYFLFTLGWWIPIIPPLISWFTSTFLITAHVSYHEKVKRKFLMLLFSKHVSDDVADAIWQQRDEFMDNGRPRSQKLIATVLFTDLKDFTSVSEKMDPQRLMDWLNEYMEAMTHIIITHKGVVNKFIGDAIMAIFGVPLARTTEEEIKQDAENAVRSAIEMEKGLIRLNNKWKKQNLPEIMMRIGIFTGPLVAGSLGGSNRMEYTVIGDTVNVASRLECYNKNADGLNFKDRPCRIIIGGKTLTYLGNKFQTTMLGEVELKGKEEKIIAYRVMGLSVENQKNLNEW